MIKRQSQYSSQFLFFRKIWYAFSNTENIYFPFTFISLYLLNYSIVNLNSKLESIWKYRHFSALILMMVLNELLFLSQTVVGELLMSSRKSAKFSSYFFRFEFTASMHVVCEYKSERDRMSETRMRMIVEYK